MDIVASERTILSISFALAYDLGKVPRTLPAFHATYDFDLSQSMPQCSITVMLFSEDQGWDG
jgi:hypothetical protein